MISKLPPRRIEVGFRGRHNPMEDPGKLDLDPLASSKLVNLFQLRTTRLTHHLYYPENDHSGQIYSGGVTTVFDVAGESKIISTPGDAVVVERRRRYPQIIALRTKDCTPLLGYDTKNKLLFGVHISSRTLVGYGGESDWLGPILKRVFAQVNPATSYIWMGPSIGGLNGSNASGCDCYEYTQTKSHPDGTTLIEAIQTHYPSVELEGLVGMMATTGKLIFQWGHILLLMLISHGVPLANINVSNNLCTACHSDRFYSHRRLKKDPERAYIVPQGIGNLSWISG